MEKDAFCSSGIRDQVFLEDGNFMAVYDLRPMLPGHALLIPKRHVMQVSELTKDELASFSWMLKKVIPVLLKTYGADSYNLAVNYGKNAGMSVGHLHFHILPRSSGDIFHRNLLKFYWILSHERTPRVRNSECMAETRRLRRIFRYRRPKAR